MAITGDAVRLGIGMGAGPMDEEDWLRQRGRRTPRPLKVVPTFASVAAWGAGPGEIISTGYGRRWRARYHLPQPLATAARITADSYVLDVFDKGKDKGAVIRTSPCSGTSRARNWRRWSRRGSRGRRRFRRTIGRPAEPHKVPTHSPDKTMTLRRARIRRWSMGSAATAIRCTRVPIAKRAGFPKPILHGICTYGITCRGILQTYADYYPSLQATSRDSPRRSIPARP